MTLRLNLAPHGGEDTDLAVPDGELASVLRTVTRLVRARTTSDEHVQTVLGTVAAELGVACATLYEQWAQQDLKA